MRRDVVLALFLSLAALPCAASLSEQSALEAGWEPGRLRGDARRALNGAPVAPGAVVEAERALPVVRAALERLLERAARDRGPSPEESALSLNSFFRRTMAGLIVTDTDGGVVGAGLEGVIKAAGLEGAVSPKTLGRGVVFDHHGAFFDPADPEDNSTMQVLDRIEGLLVGAGTAEEKAERVRSEFRQVYTDNLGDGAWTMWIVRHLDVVVRLPGLRDLIRKATWFEDFGTFGSRHRLDPRSIDPRLYDPAAVELQKAVFRVYDDAMAKKGLLSDRYESLPPAERAQVVEEVLAGMTRMLSDARLRAESAKAFDRGVDSNLAEARKAVWGPKRLDALLERRDVSKKAFDDIVVVGRFSSGRVFQDWSTTPLLEPDKTTQLTVTESDGDEFGRRTQVILALRNGKTAPSFSAAGAWLNRANVEKSSRIAEEAAAKARKTGDARLGAAAERLLAESEAARRAVDAGRPPASALVGALFGRDALQVSFSPALLRLSGEEVVVELGRYLKSREEGASRDPR